MTISSTPTADLIYLADPEVLLLSWNRKPDVASFEREYNQAFSFVEQHPHIRRFCTDLTMCGAYEPEQELWLANHFYEKAEKVLQTDVYAAVVFTETHFNAIVHNYQLGAANANYSFIHFNYFTQLPEALHWLKTIKKDQGMIFS